ERLEALSDEPAYRQGLADLGLFTRPESSCRERDLVMAEYHRAVDAGDVETLKRLKGELTNIISFDFSSTPGLGGPSLFFMDAFPSSWKRALEKSSPLADFLFDLWVTSRDGREAKRKEGLFREQLADRDLGREFKRKIFGELGKTDLMTRFVRLTWERFVRE